jgi:hypothetical protein
MPTRKFMYYLMSLIILLVIATAGMSYGDDKTDKALELCVLSLEADKGVRDYWCPPDIIVRAKEIAAERAAKVGEALVGKTFWVGTYSTSPRAASLYDLRRMLGISHPEAVRVKIEAYDPNHYGINLKKYEVEMPSGEKHWVNAALIDSSIESGALLTYDPVAKQKEQEAAEARKGKVAAAKRSAERISLIKAKKWPPAIEQAVLEKKVQIGMTTSR